MSTAVCFLALRVPEELARRESEKLVAALGPDSERVGKSFRLARPDGWHVTLYYLGERKRAALPALCADVRSRLRKRAAIQLELSRPGAFPRRGRERVLWLGARELDGVAPALPGTHAAVLDAVEAFGADVHIDRGRPFVPHVTVARPKGSRVESPLEDFYSLSPKGSWSATELELLESVRGNGPAFYETLERMPFGN